MCIYFLIERKVAWVKGLLGLTVVKILHDD